MLINNYLKCKWVECPQKRQRLAEWIQKQDPYICCLQETHLKTRDTYRLKVKGWKKIFHTNGDQKKAGVAILISDKINFKINTVKRDKKRTLHNDQRINTRRRYNNYKYICTQHKSTAIGKVNAAAAAAAAKSLQSCPTLCDPHRRQPTRLACPWDSPGKNTGVGCHFLLQCVKVKSESEVAQSYPTLHNPMDCSLPGSSVHGIF